MKTTFAICVLLSTTGCAEIFAGLATHPDRSKEVNAAIERHDLAALKKFCADESLGDPNENSVPMGAAQSEKNAIQSNRAARRDACREAAAIEGNQDDGDCTTVAERYAKARPLDSERGYGFWVTWGKRMAKCENYEAIFEQIAHVGDFGENGDGAIILEKLEKEEGIPLVAGFATYAAANPGPSFLDIKKNADYAANHIANWLSTGKHFDQCATLAKALPGASEDARARMLFYFTDAKCHKEGVSLALPLLTAASAPHRVRACRNLGDTGDASVLKKVQILAASDSYSEVQEKQGNDGRIYGVKVFPVRDACSAAAGKIQLRAN